MHVGCWQMYGESSRGVGGGIAKGPQCRLYTVRTRIEEKCARTLEFPF